MWSVGAAGSPYIMSFSLVRLSSWNYGYLIVAVIQAVLSVFIFCSLPIWNKNGEKSENSVNPEGETKSLTFREIFAIRGAVPCFLTFFGYCSLELTTSLWASSYLVQKWNFTPEAAAGYASMFYIGITFGRLVNGFLAMKFSDRFLIRTGLAMICAGIVFLFIPAHSIFTLVGFAVIGLGCAPVYPCIIHMTPTVFGADKSQAMIGLQMAFAYTGFLITPTVFGWIAEYITISLLPVYLIGLLLLMIITHEIIYAKRPRNQA